MDAYHSGDRTIYKEEVAWFCLLQMTRIIRTLESQWRVHGEITETTFLNRISALPKQFDLNADGYKDDGFALARCDKLVENDKKVSPEDRLAVLKLFHKLATREDLIDEPNPCPKRWKKELWDLAFATLKSGNSLDELISQLIDFLSERSSTLRSAKSRLNNLILEKFHPNVVNH